MKKLSAKNMLIGLDIGTSKVVAIVGEINDDGGIEIIGLGFSWIKERCRRQYRINGSIYSARY
jgi:cell division ATPase FtsA